MNELTMALDELENAASGGGMPFSYRMASSQLPHVIDVLRLQGGDMARIASLIEALAQDRSESRPYIPHTPVPDSGYTIPEGRGDISTRTGGNGVMSGSF